MRTKMIKGLLPALIAVILIITNGCSGSGDNKSNDEAEIGSPASQPDIKPLSIGRETTLLLSYLEENGDWVNSREFPSLIKASLVRESIDGNILIIDIRSREEFSKGHIEGAVNKEFSELPQYFQTGIKPFEFERIIIVSTNGQVASYTTSILRLMGYGNIYSMRWGMSAWNSSYAEKGWISGSSSEYQDHLETGDNQKPSASGMPELGTGADTGEEIGMIRFSNLFSEGLSDVMITADEVFSNPADYFIINWDRKDKYESGHIPGAFRYKPNATLSFVEEMATISTDKTVVVYCGTGHNSAFVTAYLRLFGYDARTLAFGNNGFMYDRMIEDRNTLSWLPFTNSEVNDFKTIN